MSNNTILNIIGAILVGLICFAMGYKLHSIKTIEQVPDMLQEGSYVSKLLENSPEGTVIEIELAEGIKGSSESFEGENVTIGSDKLYVRLLSFFGLGATEAAVKDQGFEIDAGGTSATFGQSKGYGILEQLWSRMKSMFWFVSFLGIILVAMLFIPATAPIAGGILRGIASIFPVMGSLVEKTVGTRKWKKPLTQTISGGQEFKAAIEANPLFDDEETAAILKAFKDSMRINQDKDSQTVVKGIKTNGIA
jgi:hypothetical protein